MHGHHVVKFNKLPGRLDRGFAKMTDKNERI